MKLRHTHKSTWLLGDTAVCVQKMPQALKSRWQLYAGTDLSLRWLKEQGLLGARFDLRRDAIGAFLAAHAIAPVPERLPRVKLIADGPGRYVTADGECSVTAVPGGWRLEESPNAGFYRTLDNVQVTLGLAQVEQ